MKHRVVIVIKHIAFNKAQRFIKFNKAQWFIKGKNHRKIKRRHRELNREEGGGFQPQNKQREC